MPKTPTLKQRNCISEKSKRCTKRNTEKLYDNNSIENVEQKLLIRLSDGKIVKQYVESLPEWAKMIVE